ncbi:MAG: hypothetical protein JJE30_06055 [Desulfuromonadales bacterium]|nr:hypothetical protein [Desulfuromonadales bacterium]
MAHDMDNLLKSDDVIVMEQEAYNNLLQIIERQKHEIHTLEFRIKTLLSGDK